jgi:hypothetical protein
MRPACGICGRPLSAPASIAAGVGPICGGRNYKGRIRDRHSSSLGGWKSLEAWEHVNEPCYTCKFFQVPGKDGEITLESGDRFVRMEGLEQVFSAQAIGGFCKKLDDLVDGNLINEERGCMGDLYRARKPKEEMPQTGILQVGEQQLVVGFNRE